MSKRKGVSAEEKRARILQIFHESQDFFSLKEIEKIASKDKGINAQYVKEIVQNLVDDGLVDSDKIGTSVYFWSYPSKEAKNKKRKLSDLTTKTEGITKKLNTVKEKLDKEKIGKKESEEKFKLIDEIAKLKESEEELLKNLQAYKDNDPEAIQKMKDDTKIFVEAANRWTDNIYAIKSWCKRKFMIEEKVLDKQFEIPLDLDYIDVPKEN